MALDENSTKVNFKSNLKFDLETDLRIKLMTDTNRARGNFGLMLFRGYALLCRRFLWLRTYVDMHFRADVFREYEISGRWVSRLYDPTLVTS